MFRINIELRLVSCFIDNKSRELKARAGRREPTPARERVPRNYLFTEISSTRKDIICPM